MNSRLLFLSALAAGAALAGGCAKKAAEAQQDGLAAAAAYYQAHPNFYHFKTIADLPKDLTWLDGADVKPFADPAAKRGGTAHFWEPDYPRTLRMYGPDAASSFRAYLLDDTQLWLVQRQPNTGQDYPGLAKEWAYDPDGQTMYFRLDPDARWSDGQPVTADDWVFMFYFFTSPNLQDPWYNNFYKEFYRGITKYDDHTFSITFYEKKPDLSYRIGDLTPIPAHFYKEFGTDYLQRYQWRVEPTTGAYTVRPEDIRKGSSIAMTRVPNWWAENKPMFRHRYNVDRIQFDIIRDSDKAIEAFKHGDIDVTELQTAKGWYNDLPDSSPLVQRGAIAKAIFYNIIPRPTYAFSLNKADPLLANHDVRVGIAYALNFDLVDKEVFHGDWVRMQTSADGYSEVPFPNIHPRPFSVEEALASFAKAGFRQRGPDGILVDAQGHRLSVTVTTAFDRLQDVLTLLRQEALKAGLELKIEVLDYTTAYKKIDEKHHQIAFAALNVTVERYPRYWEMFDSSQMKVNTNNWTSTNDPKVDAMIKAYDTSPTMDDIRRNATALEEWIREDAAYIPAFEIPVNRVAYWRYFCFPKEFETRESTNPPGHEGLDFGLFWIDDSLRPKVEAAANGSAPMPPSIKVYDQWKTK